MGEHTTRFAPALIAAGLLLGLATASAQTLSANNQKLSDENLLVAVPDGYKTDFQQRSGNMLISEMVPVAQTVADWTEMVTVQVFHDLKVTPEQLKARIDKEGPAACDGIESNPVAQGDENGYAYMVWLQSCPLNKATGKPEITWFKAIAGNDCVYVVHSHSKRGRQKIRLRIGCVISAPSGCATPGCRSVPVRITPAPRQRHKPRCRYP